jgi:outer membrane lipoprotein-sorting protein
MRLSPVLINIFLLAQIEVVMAAANNGGSQNDCRVVDGTIVCTSFVDHLSNLPPVEKGRALYQVADQKHGPLMGYGSPGYGDSQSKFVAVVKNKDGYESVREVRLKYFENAPEGNMRLITFEKPKDLKRHALLTISYKAGEDEQWVFDPDNKQVRRILSNNAFTPFSGTEITFEDISSQDVDKYTYEFLKNDTLDNQPHYVVNRFPKDKYSGYSRLETWISTETYLITKINYFDHGNKLLKTLSLNDYKKYEGKFWRASSMNMENYQTGKTTELTWSDYRFNTGLNANDFSLTSLRNSN